MVSYNKKNTYNNYIHEENITNRVIPDSFKNLSMTREDYVNYVDMIMMNSAKVPILPVASK